MNYDQVTNIINDKYLKTVTKFVGLQEYCPTQGPVFSARA